MIKPIKTEKELQEWIKSNPTQAFKNIQIQEQKREIERLEKLKSDYGKTISSIHKDYMVTTNELPLQERKKVQNLRKRQAQLNVEINILKEISKQIKTYEYKEPPKQLNFFEHKNIFTKLIDELNNLNI